MGNGYYAIYVGLHWVAVFLYVVATILNVDGFVFNHKRVEKISYAFGVAGLLVHGPAIVYAWAVVGHGPYLTAHEALTSFAWATLSLFLLFIRMYPRLKPASIIVFPSTFLMIALSLFYSPAMYELPPTFRSIWLVFHITFYKITLATNIVALACSVFYVLEKRITAAWFQRLPDPQTADLFAYRFAGFGFIFWAIAMISGSIWAYQSWGRFWGWDPVETWSLVTWLAFGLYLHLRRFFGWKGERAAWLYIGVFAMSLVAMFYTTHLIGSLHTEFFLER